MRGGLMRRWTGTQSRLSCRRRRAALSREKGTKGLPGPYCFRLPPPLIYGPCTHAWCILTLMESFFW